MDEKKILENFSSIRLTNEEMREIEEWFPQYILYRRNGKQIDGYCTGCKQYIELENYEKNPKRGKTLECPGCGGKVTLIPGGRVPVSRYRVRMNFVVMRDIGGELYMRAIKVTQRFSEGSFDEWNGISDYDTDYIERFYANYWCGTGAAAKWKEGHGWVKRLGEPDFSGGQFGYHDNSYQVIGLERAKDTCLKYCGYEKFIEICEETGYNCPLVAFLCTSAKYPALEKLMKSGFEYIVKDKLLHGGVRINYRGDTPQRILGLNTDEIKALRGCNAAEYNDYLYFRKNIRVSGDFKRKLERFERFAMISRDIVEIADRTGLSHEKVMNYIERQTKGNVRQNYLFIRDWRDYLRQCEALDYDITDESIAKPNDFQKMHERLSKLVKIRHDEIMQKRFLEHYEERRELEYESGRYVVVQPSSFDEIVAEGKVLHHCVGGYADRHARGELSIMFLRLKKRPNKPYYTIEVSKSGKIVQCRGYKNNMYRDKPKSVEAFEREYQAHLDKVMENRAKREKRAQRIKAAPKTRERIRIGA